MAGFFTYYLRIYLVSGNNFEPKDTTEDSDCIQFCPMEIQVMVVFISGAGIAWLRCRQYSLL